jgi:hypothetical protein
VVNLIGSVDEDFVVAPGGNLMHYTGGTIGDVETFSRFADDHANNPLGIVVEQRTASFGSLADAQYVIIEYAISNKSSATISNAYVGLYCDWDYPWGSGGSDRTGFSRDYGLGYMWQHSPIPNSYRGTAVLSPEGVQTYYAIRNLNNIYDASGNGLVSDGAKYRFLTHGIGDTASVSAFDQSYCIATGPFTLAPGATDTACFVMLGGANLNGLKTAVLSARAHYRQATPVDDDGGINLPSAYQLDQNHPNPFNPQTVIGYTLPRTERVSLSVYNLLGQRITTLIDQIQSAGNHSVTWDGADREGRPVASGVYFYRLKSGDFAQTKKMLLLK